MVRSDRLNKTVLIGFYLIWLYEKQKLLKKLLDDLVAINSDKSDIGEVPEFKELISAIQKFE